MIELAKLYTTVLDVQNYFPPAFKTYDGKGLLSTLQTEALYDSLFTFKQMRPEDSLDILRGLLVGIDFDTPHGSGWSLNAVLETFKTLLELTKNKRGVQTINKHNLYKQCLPLQPKQIDKVLYDVFCHPKTGANNNYSKATDAPFLQEKQTELGVDFFLKPLLQDKKGNLYLIDRSICAPAFIEGVFTELRKTYKESFDSKIGTSLENFLKQKLVQHGLNCFSGKYKINGIDGECDAVIETDDTIIFIEIKKSSLTRNASAGSDVHVLLDLTKSVLAAQKQAGGHELVLRQNNSITLDNNGVKHTIVLNARNVERIALTLFDYGGFQDRILLKQFLETSLRLRYNANDARYKKKFEELNKAIESLVDQETQLSKFRSDNHNQQPFFNCWFLSLPQLLVLLDDVFTSDDFKEQLWLTRSVTHGSQDFYYELYLARKLFFNSMEESALKSLMNRDNTNVVIS